jgi:hypothetical protein
LNRERGEASGVVRAVHAALSTVKGLGSATPAALPDKEPMLYGAASSRRAFSP